MYEHRKARPLPRKAFLLRVVRHTAFALALIGFTLGVGILGYHFFGRLSWIDSLLDASMILSGMGPVNELRTPSGKIFASFYALFSGLVFISVMGLTLAPFAHRMLHHFHWDES